MFHPPLDYIIIGESALIWPRLDMKSFQLGMISSYCEPAFDLKKEERESYPQYIKNFW